MSIKTILIFLIVPAILIATSIFLSFLYVVNFDGNFSTISYKHRDNYVLIPQAGTIRGADKIIGEFNAQYNNLGIVALPLQSFAWRSTDEEKEFIFRIKEKGSNSWISINSYKTNTFYKANIFPFGFKSVVNSKGKRFYFEFVASKGTHLSPLYLGNIDIGIVSKYRFSKLDIINDFGSLSGFIFNKIYYALNFREIVTVFILYAFLPVFYFLSIIMGIIVRKYPLSIFFFPIFLYLFIMPVKNDLAFLELIIIWIFLIYKAKLSSFYSFLITLFFLVLTLSLLSINNRAAEKSAEFTYVFFLIAIVHELFYLNKKRISARTLFNLFKRNNK